MKYLLLALLIFAINVMPAFAPGTWTILVFYKINTDLNSVALVIIGVLAAASGRYVLALGTKKIRSRLKPKYLENLKVVRENFNKGNRKGIFYIVFFMFTPLPSAQIFEAAALADVPLIPMTLAFMGGRAVGYSLSVFGANTVKDHALGSIFSDAFKSPWGIAIQILCFIGIYLLIKVDWSKIIHNKSSPAL